MINMMVGFALIWVGRYRLFENMIKLLVGFMFVTVVGTAILVSPGLANLDGGAVSGLIPRLPDGSLLYALGLRRGVGGTITFASYGYWLKEKERRGTSWIPVMRLDSVAAYVLTTVFILAMLVIGTVLLFGNGTQIDSEQGLVNVAGPLGDLRLRAGSSCSDSGRLALPRYSERGMGCRTCSRISPGSCEAYRRSGPRSIYPRRAQPTGGSLHG